MTSARLKIMLATTSVNQCIPAKSLVIGAKTEIKQRMVVIVIFKGLLLM